MDLSHLIVAIAALMAGGSLGAFAMGVLIGGRQSAHDRDARRMEALRANHVAIWTDRGMTRVEHYADELIAGESK